MKLIDLISVIDENSTVYVWAYSEEDPDSVVLVSMYSMYDRRGSIDPKFNDYEVDWVAPTQNGGIDINIDYIASTDEAMETTE